MSGLLPDTEVIMVCGGKGGVGKSTVAANLAVALAAAGSTVGLLDADLQGPSVPVMFGIADRPLVEDALIVPSRRYGVDLMSVGLLTATGQPLAWKGPLLRGALKQMLRDVRWSDPDFLIIDTPPGTGDVHMALASLVDVRGAVLVMTPQRVALSDTLRCVGMLSSLRIPVRATVRNMDHFACPHCGSATELFTHSLPGARPAPGTGPVFRLPLLAEIAASGDQGIPAVFREGAGTADSATSEVFSALAALLHTERRTSEAEDRRHVSGATTPLAEKGFTKP